MRSVSGFRHPEPGALEETHVEVSPGFGEFVSDCGRELVVKAEWPCTLGELWYLVLLYVDESAVYRGCSILEVSWQRRRRRWGAVRSRRRRMCGRRPGRTGSVSTPIHSSYSRDSHQALCWVLVPSR